MSNLSHLGLNQNKIISNCNVFIEECCKQNQVACHSILSVIKELLPKNPLEAKIFIDIRNIMKNFLKIEMKFSHFNLDPGRKGTVAHLASISVECAELKKILEIRLQDEVQMDQLSKPKPLFEGDSTDYEFLLFAKDYLEFLSFISESRQIIYTEWSSYQQIQYNNISQTDKIHTITDNSFLKQECFNYAQCIKNLGIRFEEIDDFKKSKFQTIKGKEKQTRYLENIQVEQHLFKVIMTLNVCLQEFNWRLQSIELMNSQTFVKAMTKHTVRKQGGQQQCPGLLDSLFSMMCQFKSTRRRETSNECVSTLLDLYLALLKFGSLVFQDQICIQDQDLQVIESQSSFRQGLNELNMKMNNSYKQFNSNPLATEWFREIAKFAGRFALSVYLFHFDQLNQRQEIFSIGECSTQVTKFVDQCTWSEKQLSFSHFQLNQDTIAFSFQMFANIEPVEYKNFRGYWIQFDKIKNCDERVLKKTINFYKSLRQKFYQIKDINDIFVNKY